MRRHSPTISIFLVAQSAFTLAKLKKWPCSRPAFLFQWCGICHRNSRVSLPPFSQQQLPGGKLQALIQNGAEAFKEGDYGAAIAAWEELTSLLACFSSDSISHATLLNCWSNLASAYRHTGSNKKEMEALRVCMELTEKCSGKAHPQYIHLLCRTAEANENMGKFDEMKSVLLEALEIVKKQSRSNKSDIKESKVFLLLSRAYQHLNQKREQLKAAEKGMELIRRHFSPEHRFSTTAVFTLARAVGAMGNTKEQLRLAKNAYEAQESQLGSFHGGLAESAVEVATAYSAIGNPVKEREYLERALATQNQALEPFQGPKVVDTQIQLGDAHIKADSSDSRWRVALSLYLNAIRTARQHLTAQNPSLSRALLRASQCYRYLEGENSENSAELLLEAENVCTASEVASAHVCAREILAEKKLGISSERT